MQQYSYNLLVFNIIISIKLEHAFIKQSIDSNAKLNFIIFLNSFLFYSCNDLLLKDQKQILLTKSFYNITYRYYRVAW